MSDNELTKEAAGDVVSGNATLNGVPVRLIPITAQVSLDSHLAAGQGAA